MYTLTIRRNFIAQHFLTGGDWGTENQPHSHHYRLELRLEGQQLDQHGYLADIVDVQKTLEALIAEHTDVTLNDLPAFAGLNPSLEHFARILCTRLKSQINAPNIRAWTVELWENEIASAACRLEA